VKKLLTATPEESRAANSPRRRLHFSTNSSKEAEHVHKP
jgi:hypothetical protein